MKKIIIGIAALLLASIATVGLGESGNPTCPTRPAGNNTNACASTAFVQTAISSIVSGINQLTGDVTAGPGTGSVAATLATAQPGAHTWVATQTFTLAPVFTDVPGSRVALSFGIPPFAVYNCSIAASVSSNALTVALKTQAGTDPSATSPCYVAFRNATIATGTYDYITVSSALSFSTGTSGSTFGSSNSVPFRLWITAWNNAGTLVLGVSNQSTTSQIFPINEGNVASSTTCNACTNATSAGTYYTTAAQSSKAIRILGYMDWASGLATAGTWASGPTTIQMFGPGVRKPGEVIQEATTFTASNTTEGSGTYTATGVTQTITVTEAPNLVEVTAIGTMSNDVAGGGSEIRVVRNTSTTISNLSVRQQNTAAGSGDSRSAGIIIELDAPGQATPTGYTAQVRRNPATGTASFPNTTGGRMIVKEIKG